MQSLRYLTTPTLIVLVAFGGAACVNSVYFPPSEQDGGWRKNTDPTFIRSLGVDPGRLEELGRYSQSVPNGNWKPYSDYKGTIVIKDGWIIGEWYNTPEARTFRTYLSSNGKSFAMSCFGIMVQDGRTGKIDVRVSPEDRVYDERWLPEGFPLSDPRKDEITFEEIFRHTSGLCPERTGAGEAVEQGRNQWTDYRAWIVGHDGSWPATAKVYFPPGRPEGWAGKEVWGEYSGGYSSVGFGHIGLVLSNVYGMPAHRFLWERLLLPIGFSGIDFHAPPGDDLKWFSAGGLRMTPRDYARFAYFLLHDGRWNGEQMVPDGWIQRFRLSSRYPNLRSNVDGFFGRYPATMFRIAGSGLNWAFIVPELNLIALRAARSSNGIWDEVEQTFLDRLFAALDTGEWQDRGPAPGHNEIVPDPARPTWLSRRNGSAYFMAGPGDPEDFLYRGALQADGTRSGDQMKLISKLTGSGANSIYVMAIRSHGGDGDETHNPFIEHEPSKGVNPAVLDQWDRWFTLLDRRGVTIFLTLFDDGARLAGRREPLSADERSLIRELVGRFQYHRNLIWCVAEEYEEGFTAEQAIEVTRLIRSLDRFRHPIAVHKLTGTDFSEFADEPTVDQFAMQLGDTGKPALGPDAVHEKVVAAWPAAGGRFNLNMAELAGHYRPGDRQDARLRSWAAALGGAYVMVLGMDIANTEPEALIDLGNLVRFFESVDLSGLEPQDDRALAGTEYVLASRDGRFVAYSSQSGRQIGLKGLESGSYRLTWFDCVTGATAERVIELSSSEQSWEVPANTGPEVALYGRRTESLSEFDSEARSSDSMIPGIDPIQAEGTTQAGTNQ